jgi:hypothetical protein
MGQRRKRRWRTRQLGDFPLSFGRFAGRLLKDIPDANLHWAVADQRTIPPADRWAISEYMKSRGSELPRSDNAVRMKRAAQGACDTRTALTTTQPLGEGHING